MAEEFEYRDLSDAVFWGVDLQRALFRDVDLSGSTITHARLHDVSVDARIDRLVVNGVDVTAFVNARDPWFALRSRLAPTDPHGARRGWEAFSGAWAGTIERARALDPDDQRRSVDGEWSIAETIRHLVFGIDKWFTVPVTGGSFHPLGIPNSGSVDVDWPGLDTGAEADLSTAVEAWRDRSRLLDERLGAITDDDLAKIVDVIEHEPGAVHDCIGVVFEEHFQHLRYARRDLDRMG